MLALQTATIPRWNLNGLCIATYVCVTYSRQRQLQLALESKCDVIMLPFVYSTEAFRMHNPFHRP
jgi:hypothetical protein